MSGCADCPIQQRDRERRMKQRKYDQNSHKRRVKSIWQGNRDLRA